MAWENQLVLRIKLILKKYIDGTRSFDKYVPAGFTMRVSGKSWPSFLNRQIFQLRLKLAKKLMTSITVGPAEKNYTYKCNTYTEYKRAVTLFLKEEGTISWLRDNLKPGDVVHDIGANIGLYTIFAAKEVGPSGQVCAFEPHPANTMSLMDNIILNNLGDRVKVIASALNDKEGFLDFNLRHTTAGSSMSQLSSTVDGDGKEFVPVISELKHSCTLDSLIKKGLIRSPDHVKIDVDGNELLVLAGMKATLKSESRPRTLQIEVNHHYGQKLDDLLVSYGYNLDHRHHTHLGKQLIKDGIDPKDVAHNAVYIFDKK